jgi:hypothetical protein
MMNQVMHDYLVGLCGDSQDGVAAAIIFKSHPLPVMGALRYHSDRRIFEHCAPAQMGPNTAPVMASSFFTADAVERVMTFKDMPQVITPSRGGIQIPT